MLPTKCFEGSPAKAPHLKINHLKLFICRNKGYNMNIKIRKDDNLRISSDHKERNFVDVYQVGYESMAIDFFTHFQYIEIRKKNDHIRVFTFTKKSMKKECDFGWWEDAEVILAVNEVNNGN